MGIIYAYSNLTDQTENDRHLLDLYDKNRNLYVVGGCHGDSNGKPTGDGKDGFRFAQGDQKSRKTGSGINYTYKNLSGQTSSGTISDSNEKELVQLITGSLNSKNVLICWCYSQKWIKNAIERDPILKNQRIKIVDVSGKTDIG